MISRFSQRSAAVYLDCAQRAGLLVRALMPFHYCLSPQVAEANMSAMEPPVSPAGVISPSSS